MKSTKESLDKRSTKKLEDIGNVSTGIPALGDLLRKK